MNSVIKNACLELIEKKGYYGLHFLNRQNLSKQFLYIQTKENEYIPIYLLRDFSVIDYELRQNYGRIIKIRRKMFISRNELHDLLPFIEPKMAIGIMENIYNEIIAFYNNNKKNWTNDKNYAIECVINKKQKVISMGDNISAIEFEKYWWELRDFIVQIRYGGGCLLK